MPLSEYLINEDPTPEVITKKSSQSLQYIQELAIRYLRPPTPPAPGEIVITQLPNVLTPPAPPIVVRQQPPRPATPEPLVIKEFYLIFFHFIYFLIVDVFAIRLFAKPHHNLQVRSVAK